MLRAAEAALRHSDTLPNSDFSIHEKSPNAQGTGRDLKQESIKQFPGHHHYVSGGTGREAMESAN